MILLCIDSLVGGGAQRQLVMLACGLKNNGHEIGVLTYSYDEQLKSYLTDNFVPHYVIKKNYKLDFIYLIKLTRFLFVNKPTTVISYLNTSNFWIRIAAKLAGIGKIITSERNIDIDKSFLRIGAERILSKISNHIVVNANSIKHLLIKNGISESKIEVIYNGVDIELFKRGSERDIFNFRNQYDLDDKDILFTLAGRMTIQKNHEQMIEAFHRIRSLNPNIKLMFVGNEFDVEIKKKLLYLVDKYNLFTSVIFAGQLDDMALVYSATDFLVLPSLWEGLPNVVIEAMSCQCIPIVSDVSDNAVIVDHGVNGYVFEKGNIDALISNLNVALNMQKHERYEMGINASCKIAKTCSYEKCIQKYENLII